MFPAARRRLADHAKPAGTRDRRERREQRMVFPTVDAPTAHRHRHRRREARASPPDASARRVASRASPSDTSIIAVAPASADAITPRRSEARAQLGVERQRARARSSADRSTATGPAASVNRENSRSIPRAATPALARECDDVAGRAPDRRTGGRPSSEPSAVTAIVRVDEIVRSPPITAHPGASALSAARESLREPARRTTAACRRASPGRRASAVGRAPIAATSARFTAAAFHPRSGPDRPRQAEVRPVNESVGRRNDPPVGRTQHRGVIARAHLGVASPSRWSSRIARRIAPSARSPTRGSSGSVIVSTLAWTGVPASPARPPGRSASRRPLVLSGCSPAVSMQPARDAERSALRRGVGTRSPRRIDDQERRQTDAQATGAWGDPASVLLTCGVEPPGPTTLPVPHGRRRRLDHR